MCPRQRGSSATSGIKLRFVPVTRIKTVPSIFLQTSLPSSGLRCICMFADGTHSGLGFHTSFPSTLAISVEYFRTVLIYLYIQSFSNVFITFRILHSASRDRSDQIISAVSTGMATLLEMFKVYSLFFFCSFFQ
jgi:hypothetical protein